MTKSSSIHSIPLGYKDEARVMDCMGLKTSLLGLAQGSNSL